MVKSLPLPFIAGATLVAVIFWSLKPIFISIIGDRTGYAEVFLIAGTISSAVSLIVALGMGRKSWKLIKSEGFAYGLYQSTISGAFLALWYYSFYRALFGAQKVDATIIAFTWPLVAVVAMRIFAPEHARRLTLSQWSLISIAYFGAIAIGISGIARSGFLEGWELAFAFSAALGSGLYLPFSIKAIARFTDILGSRVLATFYTVSFANLTSLVLVGFIMWGTDQVLLFYAVDVWVIVICAMIGIGTYLVAEVIWTWAFAEYKSLTLSSLAYLSPAFSVVLLYLFFDEPIASVSAFGLVLILFSNMTLHGSYRSSNALVSALIGTLYVALISLFIAPAEVPHLTDMLYFISGLFAILAGFILSRVSSRRAQEIDQRTSLVRSIADQVIKDDVATVDQADTVLMGIIDIEFEDDLLQKDTRSRVVRDMLRNSRLPVSVRQAQMLQFDTWLNIHRDRLSIGEKAALWLTGVVSILLLLIVRGNDPLGMVGLYAFSAGCLLVIFSIGDYERNSFQGFRRQILRLQDGFREIGRDYYVPKMLVDSNESLGLFNNGLVRYCDDEGVLCDHTIHRRRNSFRLVYLGSSILLVGALLTLPIFLANDTEDNAAISIRPELFAEAKWAFGSGPETDLTVGAFDWGASKVIAEIVRQTLQNELGLSVSIEETTVDEIFPILAAQDGEIDIHSDFWAGNQPANFKAYVEDSAAVRLNKMPYPGRQGVYLAATQSTNLDLRLLSDLAQPEAAAAFDTDGDGLGEIWIGAPSWRSTQAMQQLLATYGVLEFWEAEMYPERIFKAKLAQFHAQGRPIAFYGYEPDWVHAAYDFQPLTVSPRAGVCPDVLGINKAADACIFEEVPVYIGFAARIADDHPKAALLLQEMNFSTENVNAWLAALELEGKPPADVAREWLSENTTKLSTWRDAAFDE